MFSHTMFPISALAHNNYRFSYQPAVATITRHNAFITLRNRFKAKAVGKNWTRMVDAPVNYFYLNFLIDLFLIMT